MRHTTIRQALQHVADNPVVTTDEIVALPVHELICRTLFEIANNPMTGKRGAQSRANAARSMIFNRMVGKRAAGSHPATRKETRITFVSLTGEVEQ